MPPAQGGTQILGTIVIWNFVPFAEPQVCCTGQSRDAVNLDPEIRLCLTAMLTHSWVSATVNFFGSTSHLSSLPSGDIPALACVSAFGGFESTFYLESERWWQT